MTNEELMKKGDGLEVGGQFRTVGAAAGGPDLERNG
jgi:hypothetical protein